jgi:NAD(P)-dependent dehydrogenase (short-subunit alcohol dehydrogenase family)
MDNKLLGTALITGGAKRIGKVIALHLAKMGYDIVIHYNESEIEAKNLQQEIIKIGSKCNIIQADLLDTKQVVGLSKKMREIKDWSVLINNASIFYPSSFLESNIEELEKNFTIHFKTPIILSKEFALHCKINNIDGNIINMIDKNIVRYETKYFDYLLSKKSLAELTKILALELAPQIRVNGIAPGFILDKVDSKISESETQKLIDKIPLKTKAEEKNITDAAEYLLSNDFTTGHILYVDGGASLNHAG